jgi:hypothetical protein
MRTTKDLIAELRAQAFNADYVVLVVAFPNETKMVASTLSDAEALEELTVLVEQGGYPLGFIRSIRQGTRRSIESRALPEYGDDPVPGQLLRQICERMADSLERQYGVYAHRVQTQQGEDDTI